MKNILFSLIGLLVMMTGCQDKLPEASFDLYEVESFEVQAGDGQVVLTWSPSENSSPKEYYISWTTSSIGATNGELTVENDIQSITIKELTNDATYQFAIQPRYSNGLAGKVTKSVTPKNLRFPVTDLMASAGNRKVKLNWTNPASDNLVGYKIEITPGNQSISITDLTRNMYIVEDLENDITYSFSLFALYNNGESDPTIAQATPGSIDPIIVSNKQVVKNNTRIFTYNEMYFVTDEVESISWSFGDSNTSTEESPTHSYAEVGAYTVTAVVTYINGETEEGSIQMNVTDYQWSSISIASLSGSENKGTVKTSNPVFSHDGKTMYFPNSNSFGDLVAVDVESGQVKWQFALPLTYGGGPMVGEDGTVYQGASDGFYAVNADGTLKWKKEIGKIEAFPALKEGIIYCIVNGNPCQLYALNATTGSEIWASPATIEGSTGSAVGVSKTGVIVAGSTTKLAGFNQSGSQLWLVDATQTDRSSYAFNGTKVYVPLSAAANEVGGVIQVDYTNGSKDWHYETIAGDANGSCYFPIVDVDGTIYVTQRGVNNATSGTNRIHAINSNGTSKWSKNVFVSLIYTGLSLSDDNRLFGGTQAKNGSDYKLFALNTDSGEYDYNEDFALQMMSAFTIGPDKRVYWGSIDTAAGSCLQTKAINASLKENCWPVRGGNLQGTNAQP